MPSRILYTKLHIPPIRPQFIIRPRLIERLNEGLQLGRKLTLISAPAGFGKTTLVGEWVAVCGRPAAWLSLDEGDSDPARYLTYFVAALQTVVPKLGEGALEVLYASQSQFPPIEAILTTLLNEIAAISEKFFLILDDYHMVDSKLVDSALVFLLGHLPSQMHLVITTREDPDLFCCACFDPDACFAGCAGKLHGVFLLYSLYATPSSIVK